MKKLLLTLGIALACSLSIQAQEPCSDCGRAAAEAKKSRKPAMAGVATRVAGQVLGKAIINNTIGEEQPLPRQSRPKQPIEKVLNPPSKSTPNRSSPKPTVSRSRPSYAGK